MLGSFKVDLYFPNSNAKVLQEQRETKTSLLWSDFWAAFDICRNADLTTETKVKTYAKFVFNTLQTNLKLLFEGQISQLLRLRKENYSSFKLKWSDSGQQTVLMASRNCRYQAHLRGANLWELFVVKSRKGRGLVSIDHCQADSQVFLTYIAVPLQSLEKSVELITSAIREKREVEVFILVASVRRFPFIFFNLSRFRMILETTCLLRGLFTL